jgi:hypothetical protein
VTYANQDAEKHDDVVGPGFGIVDVFDTDGNLSRRFASRGALYSPWGTTQASFAFGRFSELILIGNFGNGKINVFRSRGQFIDELDRPAGKPLVIDGLWMLTLGAVGTPAPTQSILQPAPTTRPTACSARSPQCRSNSLAGIGVGPCGPPSQGVAAWVGAGEQYPGCRVAPDDLDAAWAVEIADGLERVTTAGEVFPHRRRKRRSQGLRVCHPLLTPQALRRARAAA